MGFPWDFPQESCQDRIAGQRQPSGQAIRKVSEPCLMVVGEKKREGWIRCAEESRKMIKKPNTKADYMPLFDFSLD